MFRRQMCSGGGRERGFTLIELLVAIVIGGILSWLGAVVVFGRAMVDPNKATAALAAVGLPVTSEVQAEYYLPFMQGCEMDDAVAFIATVIVPKSPPPIDPLAATADHQRRVVCCKAWNEGCRLLEESTEDK